MGAAGWWQGQDPDGVRLVRAWCLPSVRRVRRSVLGGRWPAAGRNAATENGRAGGRYRAGSVAGTAGCTQAEPPAASVPLLCAGMTGGCTRPGSWPAASIRHRHGRPGRGIASVMGTDDHDDRADAHRSSGSPGKLAAVGGRRPVPDATLYQHRETSKFFPESDNLSR
jgi:hypothetical protein